MDNVVHPEDFAKMWVLVDKRKVKIKKHRISLGKILVQIFRGGE